MTYSPAQAGVMTGEDYFTSIGILGASTGMKVLPCSMPSAMVAPYGYRDTIVPTVTGSVLKGVSTHTENKHMGWNLDGGDGSTTYTKALGVAYLCSNGGLLCHMGFSNDAISSGSDTDFLDNHYSGGVRQYGGPDGATIWKYDGGNAAVGADTSINTYQQATSPITGIALYVEDAVQKLYLKKGSESQWIQILSTTDNTFSGTPFRSYAQMYAAYAASKTTRIVTPVMVWGVES